MDSIRILNYGFKGGKKSYLVDFDVGEDHDCQGPVEAHRAGENQVADVLGEGALPGRSGAWRIEFVKNKLSH